MEESGVSSVELSDGQTYTSGLYLLNGAYLTAEQPRSLTDATQQSSPAAPRRRTILHAPLVSILCTLSPRNVAVFCSPLTLRHEEQRRGIGENNGSEPVGLYHGRYLQQTLGAL